MLVLFIFSHFSDYLWSGLLAVAAPPDSTDKQEFTLYDFTSVPTLNKHRGGSSDISSSQYNWQTLHILVVDCDLFVVLQFQHVVLANSDGDSPGTRRTEGV